jgi:hypothetical protein
MMDAIDRALLHEDRLAPSDGFLGIVMARVRLDPVKHRPQRLPWGWGVLALVAAAACSPWLLFVGRLDPAVAEMAAWGTVVAAASLCLAGLSFQLVDL